MAEQLNVDDLAAGDILLYRAADGIKNLHSAIIRLLDGTEVSHAALYLGGRNVAEALAVGEHAGLGTQPVAESVEGSQWVAVCRMEPTPGQIMPVLDVAQFYLDQKNHYAYGQILLLAGICLTRKLDDHRVLRRIARWAFDESTALLEQFRREGKEPMICSEFVYRTYDEALPEKDDPYSLTILSQAGDQPRRGFSRFRERRGLGSGPARPEVPTVHPESLLAQLESAGETPATLSAKAGEMAKAMPEPEEDLDALIEQYLAETEDAKSLGQPALAAGPEVPIDELRDSARRLTAQLADAAARKEESLAKLHGLPKGLAAGPPPKLCDVVADFVTPGDLLKSPSLKEIGKIHP